MTSIKIFVVCCYVTTHRSNLGYRDSTLEDKLIFPPFVMGDILQYIAWKFLVFIYNQRLHPNLRPLGAVEVGLVVSSPKIVINISRTHE